MVLSQLFCGAVGLLLLAVEWAPEFSVFAAKMASLLMSQEGHLHPGSCLKASLNDISVNESVQVRE